MLEEYNGLGYASRGVPSPYVWSGTDQYRSGKYVRDGVYDPNAVDSQLGCAGLLMAMMALDRSIDFGSKLPSAAASSAGFEPARSRTQPGHAALRHQPRQGFDRSFHRFHPVCNQKKEMTMWTFFDAVLFVAGYVASIYSWPRIKVWVNGTQR